MQAGNVAGYVAAAGLNEDGWRDRSPSQLRQIYGDVGYRGEHSELHFSLAGAFNSPMATRRMWRPAPRTARCSA